MQIIQVSQSEDRETWLDGRRGVITATKAKGVQPPKRGTGVPQGVFELLAENVSIAKDGEPERDRGLRLENEGLALTAKKYKIKLNLDPGMWLSDDGKLGVSPDACEPVKKPTYAAENKSLDSKNHLQAIIQDWIAKKKPNYNPLDSLKIATSDYTTQVIQYFVINPDLKVVYFTLYDDRIALENVMHYVIEIKREHLAEYIDGQETYERDALKRVDEMIKILKEVK